MYTIQPYQTQHYMEKENDKHLACLWYIFQIRCKMHNLDKSRQNQYPEYWDLYETNWSEKKNGKLQ